MKIDIATISWSPAWRIIPSLFPPVGLFDRVADPADLEAVVALDSMTNDRLRDEVGQLQLVPKEDRISGPGTTSIMAAFTHLNPEGSRFSDGTYGVLYASERLETAIAETKYHREQFLKATDEPPIELDMRVYNLDLKGQLHDIRTMKETMADIYDTTHYHSPQQWAKTLREQNSAGIVYQSIRHTHGFNAAVFRPKLLSNCRQERHLCYIWNGKQITNIYQKQLVE